MVEGVHAKPTLDGDDQTPSMPDAALLNASLAHLPDPKIYSPSFFLKPLQFEKEKQKIFFFFFFFWSHPTKEKIGL